MRKNDVVELTVDDLTTSGSGIGRVEGMAVFVPDVLPGEKVRAKVIKVKKKHAIGKLEEVLEASPMRVRPPCPVFGKCGGCTLQELAYEGQLEYKHSHVESCLERIGHLDLPVTFPLPCAATYRYRNKAAFALEQTEDGRVRIGFYAPHSHRVVDVDDCLLQDELVRMVMGQVRVWIARSGVSIYNEKTHEGLLRRIILRSNNADSYMLILVVNGREIPDQKKLLQLLSMAFPQVRTIVLNVNEERGNTLLGEENIILTGTGSLITHIGDLAFRIGPSSFLQVNKAQAANLYRQLFHMLPIRNTDTVLDLYCGVGTISLQAARMAKEVIGIESVVEAAENASFNADLNEVENARFLAGDANKLAVQVMAESQVDVAIVNPPRGGLEPELIRVVAEAAPRDIGYVSCDPATLARDMALFASHGYIAKGAQPVDMFPQTTHVETIVCLSR